LLVLVVAACLAAAPGTFPLLHGLALFYCVAACLSGSAWHGASAVCVPYGHLSACVPACVQVCSARLTARSPSQPSVDQDPLACRWSVCQAADLPPLELPLTGRFKRDWLLGGLHGARHGWGGRRVGGCSFTGSWAARSHCRLLRWCLSCPEHTVITRCAPSDTAPDAPQVPLMPSTGASCSVGPHPSPTAPGSRPPRIGSCCNSSCAWRNCKPRGEP
jgi:hypothetical protein